MRSLALLVILCTSLLPSAFAEDKITITEGPAVKEVASYTAVTTMTKAADYAPEEGYPEGQEGYTLAYQAMMTAGFERLMGWINETRHPAGAFFSIYYEDPRETKPVDLTTKQGFPVSGDYDPEVGIVIETMPAATVAYITYSGHYQDSDPAWTALMEFAQKNGYTWAGAPMEIYHKSMHETDNPAEWETEIQWPVMKADAPAEQEKMEEMQDGNGEG